jgi:hypothetical protein
MDARQWRRSISINAVPKSSAAGMVFRSGNWYEKKYGGFSYKFLLKNGTIKKTAFDLNKLLNTMAPI